MSVAEALSKVLRVLCAVGLCDGGVLRPSEKAPNECVCLQPVVGQTRIRRGVAVECVDTQSQATAHYVL